MSSEGLIGHSALIPAGTNVHVAQYGTDKGLIAEFYMEPVEVFFDGTDDKGQGIPVTRKTYRDVAYIHIFAPGNKSDIRREVKMLDDDRGPADPNRFPRQWAAFQNQHEQAHDGMPLEHWPILSKSEVLEWKAAKFHTVEQLSNMPDSAATMAPLNWRSIRGKAIAWLKAASGDHGAVVSMQSELEIAKQEIERLKTQFAEVGKPVPDAPEPKQKRAYRRKNQGEQINAS